jgi:hypothetical protein
VILATKFAHGAWAVCVLLPLMVLMLRGICRHHAIVKQAPSLRPNELQALSLPCARGGGGRAFPPRGPEPARQAIVVFR